MKSKINVCYRQEKQRVVVKKILIILFFFLIKKPRVTTAVKSNQSKRHIYLYFLGMAPASLDTQTSVFRLGAQTSSNACTPQHPCLQQTPLHDLVRGCNC